MSFCSWLPNIVSTSMLPVSGAEQLHASLAMVLRPMISASGAYSRLRQAGTPLVVRQEQVPQPALARLDLQLLHDGRVVVRISAGDQLLVKHALVGIDALVHEGQQCGPVLVAAIRECEVHPANVDPSCLTGPGRRRCRRRRSAAAAAVPSTWPSDDRRRSPADTAAGSIALQHVGRHSITASQLPSRKNAALRRTAGPLPLGGGTTRCTVDRHWSLVHCAVRSPRLITNASSAGITSIQSPSGRDDLQTGDRLGIQHRDDAVVGVRTHALLTGQRIVLAGVDARSGSFASSWSSDRRTARTNPSGRPSAIGEDLGQRQCDLARRVGSSRRARVEVRAACAGQMLGANAPCLFALVERIRCSRPRPRRC